MLQNLFSAICVFVYMPLIFVSGKIDQNQDFSHEWAVELRGGEPMAKKIADKHDFEYLGKIFDDVYHFRHRRLAKRSVEPNLDHHNALTSEPEVRWAEQQKVLRRVKRDLQYHTPWRGQRAPASKAGGGDSFFNLSDPKWPSMWYLNRGQGLDMNVQKAWLHRATGKGVVVTILDDGLEKDHPDLIQNYDPNASYDVNGHDPDPMPRYDLVDSNRHGTRCAGEVAADANNSICAVGVAYEASVGGVRMLDGDVTDAVEARSLSLNPNHIDIYSASWGPDDDGKTVDGPGQLATRAFIDGIRNGRNGKGSIFVWASGNGGRDQDNCNCDGYTNAIWTLSISSVTEKGQVPWYSEACSSTLASTYSSGSYGERQIITTDLHHKCTETHSGTSASAPLAAGICALALHANNDLTWRDMQHIVVRTAKPENLDSQDFQKNGVGRMVSHRFGYGLMDAYAMVELARNWTTVPPQRECEAHAPPMNKVVPLKSHVTVPLVVTECPGVNYLEHVQSKITLQADDRGTIEIYLISPSGTKSTLLAKRPKDRSRTGFHSWPFMTVHMWGESPLGIWKLEIHNNGQFFSSAKSTLFNWSLYFYGTEVAPGQKSNDLLLPPSSNSHPHNGKHIDHLGEEKPDQESNEQEPRHPMSSSLVPDENMPTSSSPSIHMPVSISKGPHAALPYGCTSLDNFGSCLGCMDGFVMNSGSCTDRCPPHTFLENPKKTERYFTPKCIRCHYSCSVCSGPFDNQCSECFPDAMLFIPNKDESYCHAKSLLQAYQEQGSWFKIAMVIIFLFCFCLFGVACYIYRRRKVKTYRKAILPQTSNGYGVTHINRADGSGSKNIHIPLSQSESDNFIADQNLDDFSSSEEEL